MNNIVRTPQHERVVVLEMRNFEFLMHSSRTFVPDHSVRSCSIPIYSTSTKNRSVQTKERVYLPSALAITFVDDGIGAVGGAVVTTGAYPGGGS